jgi:hypothetical protein
MFKIHEFSSAAGELSSVSLRVRDGELEILERFGAPFDSHARIATVASFIVNEHETLRHVRHLAGYDVIARDYLVYERSSGEALCALAATVSAALLHLGRASAVARSPS